MSVTASRLGQAPITLDWTHLIKAGGAGPDAEALREAWDKLKKRFAAGEVGFYEAPKSQELSQAAECQKLADEIFRRGSFTDCLFLGIGGSSLGPISLLEGLQERTSGKLRFHFMENPDPIDWKTTISRLDPAKTLVCCVAKSGTTFETIAQFLIALEWLGKPRWKTHVVAVTDPTKGDLKQFAREQEIPTLHIAPSLGGRFSVFSPVGLFPAALAGLSIGDFLQGATQVHDYCEKTPLEKNPLFLIGSELLKQAAKRPMHVCMPYSTRLKKMGSWFVQLWAESIGKDGKGFTPLAALGATDQHSILQLLRDGPDDKVTWFMTVDRVDDEVAIPRSNRAETAKLAAFTLLQGHTLHHLLEVEYRAISLVMTKRGRPHFTFRLDQLNERSFGALYFALSTMTAMTGTLWGVDPFDQPGVEEGKVYIREALSQEPPKDPADDENSPVNRLRRDRS
jgi:glucose-6-phosphate isomerase